MQRVFKKNRMNNSTSFLLKTKRGGVRKIVREHYLRDDIYCGFPSFCSFCSNELPYPSSLESNGDLTSAHFIIPDTNIVYHQVIFNPVFHDLKSDVNQVSKEASMIPNALAFERLNNSSPT